MSVKSSTELMLYVVLTMPTLNKAYLFIYLLLSNVCKRQNSMLVCLHIRGQGQCQILDNY